MSQTTDFDKVFTATPVNKTTAVVAESKGTKWEPKSDRCHVRHVGPQECKPAPKNTEDLTGMKVGRLTVLGYLRRNHRLRTSMWLVRCVCGAYEERRSKGLRRGTSTSCSSCDYLEKIRRKET